MRSAADQALLLQVSLGDVGWLLPLGIDLGVERGQIFGGQDIGQLVQRLGDGVVARRLRS